MRIIGTCMASNEADVIEAFVRHNLRFLDALVVLDHDSVDSTRDILAACAKEGLPLVVLHDPDRAFNQGARQTQMARQYLAEMNADFSFCLDADEFIKAPSRAALEAAAATIPPQAHALVELQNYFGATDALVANPLRRLTRRLSVERQQSRKVLLRRSFAADESAQVALGNHAAVRVAQGGAQPFPHALLEGVKLAHFPVRSAEQVAKKALLGWLSHRLTRPERFLGARANDKDVPASHWRDLFERLASGRLEVGDALLHEAIAAYAGSSNTRSGTVAPEELVDDPIPVPFELRYASGRASSALATLAAWSDRLVTEVNAARSVNSGSRGTLP
jgi:hypothetical protein